MVIWHYVTNYYYYIMVDSSAKGQRFESSKLERMRKEFFLFLDRIVNRWKAVEKMKRKEKDAGE